MAAVNYDRIRDISRNISMIENEIPGYEELLLEDNEPSARIVGITGAPGSGKSTLADALIGEMVSDGKRVAVLCTDPSSPFNRGALLGDRIRMSEWYNHPGVFIRSLASRGALGGLHPHIIEITEYIKKQGFDFVIIETVGVGQSEVDIAALADFTIVVLVPESGDSIQSMKSGLMEIADIFVVNKSDRPGADVFYNSLKKMIGPAFRDHEKMTPVFRVTAIERIGVKRLYDYLKASGLNELSDEKKQLLAQKGFLILQSMIMSSVDDELFKMQLFQQLEKGPVNLFAYARKFAAEIKKCQNDL